MAEFGPLNESVHKFNEFIPLASLRLLTSVCENLLERLLARTGWEGAGIE